MAISTYGIYLMHKTSTTYEKLIDIKDFPDLGGASFKRNYTFQNGQQDERGYAYALRKALCRDG